MSYSRQLVLVAPIAVAALATAGVSGQTAPQAPYAARGGVATGGLPACVATETQKLVAFNGTSQVRSVSIDGDVLIVGAPLQPPHGAAYIYRHNGSNWVLEAKLTDPSGQTNDNFGFRVAIHGDVAILGVVTDDDNGNNAGSAFVYRHDGTEWIHEQTLLASDGAPDDAFGVGVSIRGDLAIVGAAGDDDNKNNGVGSAYIFRFDGTQWVQEQKLLASDPLGQDLFGSFVSISGDAAIVGAYWDAVNGFQAGAAYIFRYDRLKQEWIEEVKLRHPDGVIRDNFGWSVSIDGDVAIVGVRGDDDKGFGSGSAFVYRYDGSRWIQEDKLLASDGVSGNHFGYSVAVRSDRIICGAWKGNGSETDSGSAYVFRFDGSTWVEEAKLIATDGSRNDEFGFSSAIDGANAVVASRRDDSAYVFAGLADCNENGILDLCDVADGTSADANGNGIPDECEAVVVDLDIEPGDCPNEFKPRLGNSGHKIDIALLGTADFDVTEVDFSTILLSRADGMGGAVLPERVRVKDRATPFEGDPCGCHELKKDGIPDLRMRFFAVQMTFEMELDPLAEGESVEQVPRDDQLDRGSLG